MLRGGDSGPAVVAGRAAESLAMQRMLLPPDHDDRMPPSGKSQPSADRLALLRWWIEAGAPVDKTARDLQPPEPIRRLLE
jgi:hypothetical protein